MITPPAAPRTAAIAALESDDEDELGASIWETSRTARLFSAEKKQEEEEPGIKATIAPASGGGRDDKRSNCPIPAVVDVAALRKIATFDPAVKFNDPDHGDASVRSPMPELTKGSREKKTPRYGGSAFASNPLTEGKSLRGRKPTLFFHSEFGLEEKRAARKQKLRKKETPRAKLPPQKKNAPPELLDHGGDAIKEEESRETGLEPSAADQIELILKPVKWSATEVPKSNGTAGVYYEGGGKWVVQIWYQKCTRYFGAYGSREEALLANRIAREQLEATAGVDGRRTSGHEPLTADEIESKVKCAQSVVAMAMGTNASGRSSGGGSARLRPDLHNATPRAIKPRFKSGDRVYAAWWEDEWRRDAPAWYPGVIKSCVEVWIDGDVGARRQYGPRRLYSVEYDDGDELDGVEDYYVFSEEDYLLLMRNSSGQAERGDDCAACSDGNGGNGNWVGVKNITDEESSDRWANTVGWYNATLADGAEQSFSFLSDALRVYDASVVRANKRFIKEADPSELKLNFPEDYQRKAGDLEGNANGSDRGVIDSGSRVNRGGCKNDSNIRQQISGKRKRASIKDVCYSEERQKLWRELGLDDSSDEESNTIDDSSDEESDAIDDSSDEESDAIDAWCGGSKESSYATVDSRLATQGGRCIEHGAKVDPRLATQGGLRFGRRTCNHNGCTNKAIARGLCNRHRGYVYRVCSHEGCTNWARSGNGLCLRHGAKAMRCKHDGCTNLSRKGGFCRKHSPKEPCKFEGCTNKSHYRGFCLKHGTRRKRRRAIRNILQTKPAMEDVVGEIEPKESALQI